MTRRISLLLVWLLYWRLRGRWRPRLRRSPFFLPARSDAKPNVGRSPVAVVKLISSGDQAESDILVEVVFTNDNHNEFLESQLPQIAEVLKLVNSPLSATAQAQRAQEKAPPSRQPVTDRREPQLVRDIRGALEKDAQERNAQRALEQER